MPDPSPDRSRLLEPSNIAYEIAVTTDRNVATEIHEAESEEAEGYIAKKLGIGFWVSIGWISTISLLAILAPWITKNRAGEGQFYQFLQDPTFQGTRQAKYLGPSLSHWIGTDDLARDMFARIIWGARVSLAVGFASIAFGLIVGTIIGLLSGYMKGWVDNVLSTLVDVILAFPALLLAMAIITFTDAKDIAHISFAIGVVAIPAIARLVRANTLSFREREFVLASRTLGASHLRVLAREILPNVVPPVVSFAVIGVAVAIAAESGLAFVGVSVPPPTPTWGGMINDARSGMTNGHAYQVFVPCLVLVLTIMALYFAGDRLRQYFDVKESVL